MNGLSCVLPYGVSELKEFLWIRWVDLELWYKLKDCPGMGVASTKKNGESYGWILEK